MAQVTTSAQNTLVLPPFANFSPAVRYGVATISRLLKIYVTLQNVGLFCRALLQNRPKFLENLQNVANLYSTEHTYLYIYIYVYICTYTYVYI